MVEDVLGASVPPRESMRDRRCVPWADQPARELEDAGAFCQRVLGFALGYADTARRDWQRFVGARTELDHVEGWAEA